MIPASSSGSSRRRCSSPPSCCSPCSRCSRRWCCPSSADRRRCGRSRCASSRRCCWPATAYAHLLSPLSAAALASPLVHLARPRARHAGAADRPLGRVGRAAGGRRLRLADRHPRRSASACRSSPSRPTRRCCRPGSPAPAIRTRSDPYFLYGASNLGSLIALLAYPIAIEPFSGLAHQATIWAAGFMALAAMIAVCGVIMVGAARDDAGTYATSRPRRTSTRAR